jgi:hypothetical protein
MTKGWRHGGRNERQRLNAADFDLSSVADQMKRIEADEASQNELGLFFWTDVDVKNQR